MYTANFPNITNQSSKFTNISVTSLNYIHAASDPNWSFHLHSHPDTFEISYVFSGQSALFCGDKFYETHPGDLIIKNCNVVHAEKSDINNPIEQVCINISGLSLENLPDNYLIYSSTTPIFNVGGNKPLFDALFKYILNQTVDTMNVDLVKINSVMASILEILYDDYHLNLTSEPQQNNKKDIKPVKEYIEKNYALNLSIDSLAKEFFISPFYLSKKFKAETGFTINQYILGCRMGEAERLLIFSNLSVKDIAITVGYENLPYFYTTFKKYSGCTPVDYKNKYLR